MQCLCSGLTISQSEVSCTLERHSALKHCGHEKKTLDLVLECFFGVFLSLICVFTVGQLLHSFNKMYCHFKGNNVIFQYNVFQVQEPGTDVFHAGLRHQKQI